MSYSFTLHVLEPWKLKLSSVLHVNPT